MGRPLSTNINLSQMPEVDEKKDPKVYGELVRLRSAILALQEALDIYTGALGETDSSYFQQTPPTKFCRVQNISRIYVQATESIAAGALVNLYNNSGTLCARNAQSGPSKAADAYSSSAVAASNYGEFILWGLIGSSAALTPRALYYLTNTPGVYGTVAGAGLVQKVGWAISDHILFFRPDLV